jgi:hypothetical protein
MSENKTREQVRQEVIRNLRDSDLQPQNISKTDFTLFNGEVGDTSKIAEYEAPYPITLREQPIRMMLPNHDAFYHDGTVTPEQTHSLGEIPLETTNTNPFDVYADDTRLSRVDSAPGNGEYSVDYGAGEITVEQDTDVTIHTFYFTNAPVKVSVFKRKPGTVADIGESVYDDITADLHERDQNDSAPSLSFNDALEPVIPTDWKIIIYADSDEYSVQWDDSNTDTSGNKTVNGVSATNAIVNLPAFYSPDSVAGLNSAVSESIGIRR